MELFLLIAGIGALLAFQKPKSAPLLGDEFLPLILRRNFRQNNPLNIKPNPDLNNPWQGQIGVDDRGLCIFDTMANGLRAGAIAVLHEFLVAPHLNLWDFGDEWAPPRLQKPPVYPGTYGLGLALILHVGAKDPYNARSSADFVHLLDAIIQNENGGNPIGQDALGIAAAQAYRHFKV